MRTRALLAGLLGLAGASTAIAADAPAAPMPAHNAGIAVSVASDARGDLWLARAEHGHVLVGRIDANGQPLGEPARVNAEVENVRADGQNRPKLAVHGDTVAVLWAQSLSKRFSGNVRFARSTDGGKTFAGPVTVNSDREEIGHSFGALASDGNGRLAIAWLDARDGAAAKARGEEWNGSSLYYVLSDDMGATFTENRRLATHTCQCCRVALAWGADAPVALWRHIFGSNTRDFAIATLDAGAQVHRASKDGWRIDGCPHHGGDIAIDAQGRHHLVWFTGSPTRPGLYYRHVDGRRMGKPMHFGDNAAQAGHPAVFAREGEVHIVWREFAADRFRLMHLHSADRGKNWAAPRELASAGGNTDLPLFVTGTPRALLHWQTDDGLRLIDLQQVLP
jgi:hypothetical protein